MRTCKLLQTKQAVNMELKKYLTHNSFSVRRLAKIILEKNYPHYIGKLNSFEGDLEVLNIRIVLNHLSYDISCYAKEEDLIISEVSFSDNGPEDYEALFEFTPLPYTKEEIFQILEKGSFENLDNSKF